MKQVGTGRVPKADRSPGDDRCQGLVRLPNGLAPCVTRDRKKPMHIPPPPFDLTRPAGKRNDAVRALPRIAHWYRLVHPLQLSWIKGLPTVASTPRARWSRRDRIAEES